MAEALSEDDSARHNDEEDINMEEVEANGEDMETSVESDMDDETPEEAQEGINDSGEPNLEDTASDVSNQLLGENKTLEVRGSTQAEAAKAKKEGEETEKGASMDEGADEEQCVIQDPKQRRRSPKEVPTKPKHISYYAMVGTFGLMCLIALLIVILHISLE